jgi:hypothetical protein
MYNIEGVPQIISTSDQTTVELDISPIITVSLHDIKGNNLEKPWDIPTAQSDLQWESELD